MRWYSLVIPYRNQTFNLVSLMSTKLQREDAIMRLVKLSGAPLESWVILRISG